MVKWQECTNLQYILKVPTGEFLHRRDIPSKLSDGITAESGDLAESVTHKSIIQVQYISLKPTVHQKD